MPCDDLAAFENALALVCRDLAEDVVRNGEGVRHVIRVEVTNAATPSLADIAGLRRLAAQCGHDFAGGLLLHAGAHTLTLDDPRFLAVPIAKLWGM